MDNVTHTLLALTLANAGIRRVGPGATATLVLASNVPDIEFVTRFAENGRLAYLAAHRGPTHGPLGLALGASMAAVVWLCLRRRRTLGDRVPSFPALVAVGIAGVMAHVLVDLTTSYGTRVLSPFSGVWYGVDWMPILDLWLWGILAAGSVVGWALPPRRRAAAVAVLLTAASYAGLRAFTHGAAVSRAAVIQSRAGVPVEGAPAVVFAYRNTGRLLGLPAALPAGSSPFAWRLITKTPSGFEVRDVNLLRAVGLQADEPSLRFPDSRSPLVAPAATAPTARVFLDFSRFTSVEVRPHRNGDATVHWYDMRFARPAAGIDERHYTSPFGAWVRLAPDGRMLRYGLGPG